jgi:lipoprotein-releasing system permease protein
MKYEWFIASRYLKSRRKQAFISIISIISVSGVTLGIAAVIIVVSTLEGFGHEIKEKFLVNEAHITVQSARGHFPNYQEKIEQIQRIEGVVAASPVIFKALAIQTQGSESLETVIPVKGIDLQQEDSVTGFSDFVKDFESFNQSRFIDEAQIRLAGKETIAGGIILGYHVARRIGVVPGDVLRLISKMVQSPANPGTFMPLMRNFVVVGLYQSGLYLHDNVYGFIDLQTAQTLYQKPDQINLIEVRLVHADMASTVSHQIKQELRFEPGLGAIPITTTWMESRADFFEAFELEKIVTMIVVALIILVAVFNIASTLIMMVMEKTQDIGILRAMGASKHGVRKIFILQGGIIGILGSILGTALGVYICWRLDFQVPTLRREYGLLILLIPIVVQMCRRVLPLPINATGLLLLWCIAVGLSLYFVAQPIYLDNILGKNLSSVYQLNRLPVKISWGFVGLMNLLSMATCWLAALYPASKASHLNPVEALRHE